MVTRSAGEVVTALMGALFAAYVLVPVLITSCGVAAASSPGSTPTPTPSDSTREPATTRRTKPLWNQTQTDRLKHDLLLGYDKFARPHEHDARTDVDLLIVLKHITVDEFAGVMSIDVWIKMFWTDPKLTWKPSQYGNLSTLYVPDHEIWQPDIMLYNSATGPGMSNNHYETSHLVVSHDGGVFWVPTTRLDVYCNLDFAEWPFDIHTCEFKMGSWVYDKANMDIIVHNETFTHDPHIEHATWTVLEMKFDRKEKMYPCCPESYVDISFNLTARRRGAAYFSVLCSPLFASILLLFISFLVPYQRVEKTLLHGVNIVMLTICLMYLSRIVPVLSFSIPVIMKIYSSLLMMACSGAGIAVGLQRITSISRPWAVPAYLRNFVICPATRWFMFGALLDEVVETSRTTGNSPDAVSILPGHGDSHMENMTLENSLDITFARNRRDWNYVAIFTERCFFVFWVVTFFSFLICIA